jgi:uncharacterized protein YukE
MALTMLGLARADTARLHALADRWARVVTGIDGTVEDLVAGTRDLPDHWTGEGAQAAQDRAARLQARVGNARYYCDGIRAALTELADELAELRRRLDEVVAGARAGGLDVDVEAGTVSVPAVDAPISQAAGTLRAGADLVGAVVAGIDRILAQAGEADRRAAARMTRCRVEWYDLPETLAPIGQTDLDVLPTYDPAARATYWNSLHQLNRDRLIAEHPELVATLEGFPAQARREANRLRETAALLRSREQLADLPGGAGGQLQEVDRRIADVG